MVSSSSGRMYHRAMMNIFSDIDSFGILPIFSFSRRSVNSYSSGILLRLHLRMMTPSFSSTRPGLLRMMVCSVVSSVWQKVYSAPVRSRQPRMPRYPLAVRQ